MKRQFTALFVLVLLGAGRANAAKIESGPARCAQRKTGSPGESIELLNQAVIPLPETGKTLHRFVYISKENGEVALCDTDENGREADEHALREEERAARVRNHGRLSPRIERAIEGREDTEKVHVVLHVPVFEPQGAAGSNLLRDSAAAAAEAKRVDEIVQRALPGLQAFLGKGTVLEPLGSGTPFVKAYLTVKQITKLGHSELVGNIYDGERVKRVPLGLPNNCRVNQYSLTQADKAHTLLGLTGKGVKLATLEQVCKTQNIPFDPSDPAHNIVASTQAYPNCADPDDHAAQVLGYIQNTDPYDSEQNPPDPNIFGMAPHAELFSADAPFSYSAGYWPFNFAAYTWLAANKVAIANASFFENTFSNTQCPMAPSPFNEVADYFATHAPYVLTVAASADGPVYTTGCCAYKVDNILHNGITVGGVFDHQVQLCSTCAYTYEKDTDPTLDWTGRWVPQGEFFAWKNPDAGSSPMEVGDLELPQMAAYADDMTALLNPAFTACWESGTSFSAPLVSGAAALVSEQNAELYGRPEALRAVLYAGADVNTDLATPGLGPAYSYKPIYNAIGLGSGVDRHGGMGLLNAYASAQIAAPASRLQQNQQSAPQLNGHDYGVLDPKKDFSKIWYKNNYYFAPASTGTLRIVLTWNRPYTCTMNPLTCGPDFKPSLNMVLRDMAEPKGFVSNAAAWDPDEQLMAASVLAGHTYRLDIYMQNYWPGPESFGLASWFTTNPQ